MRAVICLPRKGAAPQSRCESLPFVGALASDPKRTVVYVCTNGSTGFATYPFGSAVMNGD